MAVGRVPPESLAARAHELAAWCDLDPPTQRDLHFTLSRDTDQACFASDTGAVIGVGRGDTGFVKYLAVNPRARRQGTGGALLDAVEAWAKERGWATLVVGPAAPLYLWPGVELGLTSAERFLLGRRYRVAAVHVNQQVSLPVSLDPGAARVARADEVETVAAFCREHYPNWEAEVRASFARADDDLPRCAVWVEDGDLLGFACWSVVRDGWFGPMATRPDIRGSRGIGTGTLAVALAALAAEGRTTADIAWSGPERFYMRVSGARTHRAFRVFARSL